MIPLKLIENFCEQNPEFELIRSSSFISPRGGYNSYYLTYKYPSIVLDYLNPKSIGYYLGKEVHSHIVSSFSTRPFGDPINLTETEVVDLVNVNVSFDYALDYGLEDKEIIPTTSLDEFNKAVSLFKKNMTEFVMQLKKMNIKSASREYEV